MQSKDRALRVLALVHAIDRANRATTNPFVTMAQIDKAAEALTNVINNVLDSEYEQGVADAIEVAVKTIRSASRRLDF